MVVTYHVIARAAGEGEWDLPAAVDGVTARGISHSIDGTHWRVRLILTECAAVVYEALWAGPPRAGDVSIVAATSVAFILEEHISSQAIKAYSTEGLTLACTGVPTIKACIKPFLFSLQLWEFDAGSIYIYSQLWS